ncbi:F-box family protein [Tasmannia lanceolata]|uniref:F-box family protein n=1 Tax=Tasmannia lanceolata TaxID=3420 RepID=UPI004064B04E
MNTSSFCGSHLFLSLPDDVLSIISRYLQPIDIYHVSLCCRSLQTLALSEKLWLIQCQILSLLTPHDLLKWRSSLSSYKSLYKFLSTIKPLLGLWVHQNPELGNVVYTMLGFVSLVGCRIIPQELGERGIDDSPLLWAPVFEIIAKSDGSAVFFLHGREKDADFFYPGMLNSVDVNCNVLLLEVNPRKDQKNENKHVLLHNSREICRSESSLSRSQSSLSRSRRVVEAAAMAAVRTGAEMRVPFGRLAFGDRRRLLELVANQVRLKVPESLDCSPLFPRCKEDLGILLDRRLSLIEMYMVREGWFEWVGEFGLYLDGTHLELSKMKKIVDRPGSWNLNLNGEEGEGNNSQNTRRRTVAGYFRDGLNQILGRSNSVNRRREISKNGISSSENKHVPLHEFLRVGDGVGLSLRAVNMKLSTYRAWPNMHDNRFALYKLPLRAPMNGQEYAGLWGGTMGWPPGRPTEDKPGKALFFLLLSYEESEGQRLLIATKILEGTHYVLHPNGSAMFIVNVDEPSSDRFPWDTDGDSLRVEIQHAYSGEGIANGYGFRYPGSKPGSLFVAQNGLLAFVWKETRAVLTLQRLDLQELLKKGERVPPLPPIANFSYLTKSYSNVFAGFSSTTNCLSSSRQYYC